MKRYRFAAGAVAALAACAAAGAPSALAVPVDPCDRFWTGESFPGTNNINYPDEFAGYWSTTWKNGLPSGAEITLKGRFPRARYASFNTYSFNQPPASAGPNDSLYDAQIEPDAGFANPFVAGNRRGSMRATYTIRIVSGPAPADPASRAPNTLYTGRDAGLGVTLVYRIYLPDRQASLDGDAGLPDARLRLADGSVIDDDASICATLEAEELGGAQGLIDAAAYSRLRTRTRVDGVEVAVPPPAPHPSVDPARWERFFNYRYSLVGQFHQPYPGFSTPLTDRATIPATASGGPLSNRDAYTMVAFGDRSYGQLMVIRGRAPSVPPTFRGNRRMGSGDVRYWSFCQNEFQSSEFVDCVFDQSVPLSRGGRYTIVTGLAEDRPWNARRACGIAWLDWPVEGDGAPDFDPAGDPRGIPGTLLPAEKGGRREMGLIAYRQILPDPAFNHIGKVTTPGAEASVLGEYLPRSTYSSPREVARLGCRW